MNSTFPRRIVVLGSTGSIGTQTLDIVRRLGPERAQIVGLAARQNVELLAEQARQFGVTSIAVTETQHAARLTSLCEGTETDVLSSDRSLITLATLPEADTVVVSVAGAAALEATLAAAAAGKRICIATKEVLVAAGELVLRTARESGAEILPVDSEHSAIFQCLQGYERSQIQRIWLTASGGPFRTWERERIDSATIDDALNHPTWRMGGKITIDSATLMNKGLEVIEAVRLFGLPPEDVKIVVHPQSVVHSFVETTDGSLLAQLGLPDMRLPIQIALMYPEKPDTQIPRMNPTEIATLTFEAPDTERFPAIGLAYRALEQGGTQPAALNAANEEAVGLFLAGRIPFGRIISLSEAAMDSHEVRPADSLEAILEADSAARHFVRSFDV